MCYRHTTEFNKYAPKVLHVLIPYQIPLLINNVKNEYMYEWKQNGESRIHFALLQCEVYISAIYSPFFSNFYLLFFFLCYYYYCLVSSYLNELSVPCSSKRNYASCQTTCCISIYLKGQPLEHTTCTIVSLLAFDWSSICPASWKTKKNTSLLNARADPTNDFHVGFKKMYMNAFAVKTQ